jgi:hypothetical protein
MFEESREVFGGLAPDGLQELEAGPGPTQGPTRPEHNEGLKTSVCIALDRASSLA